MSYDINLCDAETKEPFKPGMHVKYIPMHANGDIWHEDCELGIVSSTNDSNVFVKYRKKYGSGYKDTAQATDPCDLILINYADDR